MDKQPSKKEILEQVNKLRTENESDSIELANIKAERETKEKEFSDNDKGIPVFITNKLKSDLMSFGINDDEINKLKPQEAWNLLKKRQNAKEILEKEDVRWVNNDEKKILDNPQLTKEEKWELIEDMRMKNKYSKKRQPEEKKDTEELENIDEKIPLLTDIEGAREIFGKLPEEDKQKIGWGLKTLGFKVEQKKNNFFAKTFNKISEKLPEGKITSRFCKNLGKGFIEDSEKAFKTAENISSGKEKHKIQNTGLLFGNILRYGRMITDLTGASFASPLRYVMMGGMALTRGAKAATETRLESEGLIEKTRIEDADKAAEEAWKIYELAQKKEGVANVSADALKSAYLTEIPKDLQKRLQDPGTANNFIQNVLRKYLKYSIDEINSKIGKIENNTEISQAEKEIKIESILNKQKQKLLDYDSILTQIGTVDELAMAGRYAQTAGKVIVATVTVETLYLSYEKISGLLSHIFSGSEISVPIHTGTGKNIIEETIKEKTNSQIESKDFVPENKDLEELKDKILEQFKTSEMTVHKGEGIEHSFIRQIEHNPGLAKELGFEGDENDAKALHEFAGKQAHIIAKETGYVDDQGREVRIAEADKVAYEIKMENGHVVVEEKTIVDGKIEIVEIHHEGDKFEEKLDKYERVFTQPHHEVGAISDSEQDHLDAKEYADKMAEQIGTKATADIKAVIENQYNHSNKTDILDNVNKGEKTEYVNTGENYKIIGHDDVPKKQLDYENLSEDSKYTPSGNTINWIKGTSHGKFNTIEEWIKSPENVYHLSPEQLDAAMITHAENVSSLLFENEILRTGSDAVGNLLNEKNADILIGAKENDIKEIYVPLYKYINKLYELTGLEPLNETLLQKGEVIATYIERALIKVAAMGKLNEVKL